MPESTERLVVRNPDTLAPAVNVQQKPPPGETSNAEALYVAQRSTSGKGAAIVVQSDNSAAPAAVVQGAGTLLDLRNSSGASQFSVGQSGVSSLSVASGGAVVTGDSTITGAFDVDGFALGEVSPDAQNLVAWTYDPTHAVNNIALTSGTVYLAKLHISRDVSVTKLYWWMSVVGETVTAGQNFGGLYSSAGERLVTADADATVTATAGLQTLTIASTSLTAGSFVWGALVFNAGTGPTIQYGSGATGAGTACNVGLSAAAYRYATAGTSQTSLPETITPASNAASLIAGPWMAVGV